MVVLPAIWSPSYNTYWPFQFLCVALRLEAVGRTFLSQRPGQLAQKSGEHLPNVEMPSMPSELFPMALPILSYHANKMFLKATYRASSLSDRVGLGTMATVKTCQCENDNGHLGAHTQPYRLLQRHMFE